MNMVAYVFIWSPYLPRHDRFRASEHVENVA